MSVKDPASALGEAVGKLIEEAIVGFIKKLAGDHGLKASGKKLVDRVGIDFDIDLVLSDMKGNPIALIDIKYLRYKKHARDKGSWVVVAHNRLRATYPSIKRCLVILLGTGWTDNSKKLMATSCTDVIDVSPGAIGTVLSKFGIAFTWHEKDAKTPRVAWQEFQKLKEEDKEKIKAEVLKVVGDKIEMWFKKYLVGDPDKKLKLDYFCERVTS
ncbi:MAG: hypothetical protein ACTSXC_07545 [Candidatus Freyarchaeota archaeon]